MTITIFSSRQFNQEVSEAKRAASNGPAFITNRGRPTHVLMTFEHYQGCSFAGQVDPLRLPLPPGPRKRRAPVVRPLEPQFF